MFAMKRVVALTIAGSDPTHVTSTVCGTNAMSVRLVELQLGLAEGPIADALGSTFPVLAPDLAEVSHPRWLWFAPAAVAAGAAALFVLPLCVAEVRVGALSLYRSTSGDLTAEQFDDFAAFADAATLILATDYSDSGQQPGAWAVGEGSGFQPEIHQAVGVIMGDLEVDAKHALVRLRAHAYASEQPISAAAHDIVGRQMRLEPDVA